MFFYHLTFATAKVIQIFDMCKYFFHFMEIILWKNKKNRALLPCSPISYTPLTESKNIFFIFVRDEIPYFRFISFYRAQRFYLVLFTPRACALREL